MKNKSNRKRIIVIFILLLVISCFVKDKMEVYADDVELEYSWYSSIEVAISDANNLVTTNADTTYENAEVGLFVDNETAYISIKKDIDNVNSLNISQNMEIDLNDYNITFAINNYFNVSNAKLTLNSGTLNFENVSPAINVNASEMIINNTNINVSDTDEINNVNKGIYVYSSSSLIMNSGCINVDGKYINYGIINNGSLYVYGGYIYAKPIPFSSAGDSSGTGVCNNKFLFIEERNNQTVTVIGGNAGLTLSDGSSTVINSGTFISPNHGGAYVCSGATGYCEINGGTFKVNRSLWTEEELGNIRSFGGMYVGASWITGEWSVDIRNATIIGGAWGIVQKSNHGYIPATINLYECVLDGYGGSIFVQNNSSVGEYNAYVNIYDGTRLINDTINDLYEVATGESHVIDHRNPEYILNIIEHPDNITTSIGTNITMGINATGKNLKYQWQLSSDGGNTWRNSNVDGYNSANIFFSPTEAFHGRMYRCVITDDYGQTIISEPALILLTEYINKAFIRQQPEDITVSLNNRANISVNAIGEELTYQWEVSKDGGYTWNISNVDGYNTPALTFIPTRDFHGRLYRCVVTNGNGHSIVSEPALLLIEELVDDLIIIKQPKDIITNLVDRITMPVVATGEGLSYQWELSNDGGITWNTSNVDGYNTSAITFVPTTAYHGRMYRCIITDANNNKVTSEHMLICIEDMLSQVKIVRQPQDVETSIGTITSISVLAVGEGLTYQWQLSNDNGVNWSNSTVDGYNTPNIIFSPIDTYQGRLYRCVITDKNGNVVTTRGAQVTLQ